MYLWNVNKSRLHPVLKINNKGLVPRLPDLLRLQEESREAWLRGRKPGSLATRKKAGKPGYEEESLEAWVKGRKPGSLATRKKAGKPGYEEESREAWLRGRKPGSLGKRKKAWKPG